VLVFSWIEVGNVRGRFESRVLQTDFEIRFSVQIEMFVTSISFRGTFKSFWYLAEVSEQSWYKVLTYELVKPTFKISLLRVEFLLKTDSGYFKDTGVNKPGQPLGIPSAIIPSAPPVSTLIEN